MAGRQKLGGFDADYAKTPGPAGYALMNPDIYQKKAPAYSMLSRQFMPGGRCTETHKHCPYMYQGNNNDYVAICTTNCKSALHCSFGIQIQGIALENS